jgi:hypothetical protein
MRSIHSLASLVLALALTACSGTEIRPADTAGFAAGNYHYFKWRSEPLQNTANSSDPVYVLDPIVRRQVNSALADKGFVLDEKNAQFSVDYFFAEGMREGKKSQVATNITPYPTVVPNRQADGATVDNAYALGGVKKTSNIALQFNDVERKEEVWHVIITKIVEDANMADTTKLDRNVGRAIRKGLQDLPAAQ